MWKISVISFNFLELICIKSSLPGTNLITKGVYPEQNKICSGQTCFGAEFCSGQTDFGVCKEKQTIQCTNS